MKSFRRVIVGCVCLAGLPSLAVAQVGAQPVDRYEYEIKARVIRTLSIFVTWPPEAAPKDNQPLIIGVLGQDPFYEAGVNQLDRMVAAEVARKRNVLVRRFDSVRDYEKAGPCHILFVSDKPTDKSIERTLAERLTEVKKLTKGKPVLLVGQSPDFAQQGGSANLLYDRGNNNVRFQLNPDEAKRANLIFAAGLLRLDGVEVIRDKN
ncbi:MAG: YfiR family protein [Planctomycetaceae bacterium]